MRILLIEDDKYLSETLSFQLVHAGFTVDSCENGEDALYYMKECFYASAYRRHYGFKKIPLYG